MKMNSANKPFEFSENGHILSSDDGFVL